MMSHPRARQQFAAGRCGEALAWDLGSRWSWWRRVQATNPAGAANQNSASRGTDRNSVARIADLSEQHVCDDQVGQDMRE